METPNLLPASSLRPATLDDLLEIVRIENEVHVSPWTRDHFEAELEKPFSQFLVLTDDETDSIIFGYIVFWLMSGTSADSVGVTDRAKVDCEILNIAVALPYRGLGLAKQMVHRAAHLCHKAGGKRISLEVRVSNKPAIQLYQALKFVICQVRRHSYSNGEDAYRMVLELEGSEIDF